MMSGAPVESILALTADLVRTPSRAGRDDYAPVIGRVEAWLRDHGLPFRRLADDDGRPLAILLRVGPETGPAYLLNATVDTASFGDEAAWTTPPTGAEVRGGWMHGRGAADSKVAVALFCHVARALRDELKDPAGSLVCAFDADEHTGRFGGIRACLEALGGRVAGGAIGYPGNDRLLVGARGFWRARVQVHGEAAHSGARHHVGCNAAAKAAALVAALERVDVGRPGDGGFPLPGKVTVTGLQGGGDFSIVPGRCVVELDVRLTPAFDAKRAESSVRAAVEAVDRDRPGERPSSIEILGGWPPYRIDVDAPFVQALAGAAADVLGRSLPLEVAGPSNTGNYLATHGVGVTCGFGVTARDIHAPDEAFEVASLAPVYQTYVSALRRLLSP